MTIAIASGKIAIFHILIFQLPGNPIADAHLIFIAKNCNKVSLQNSGQPQGWLVPTALYYISNKALHFLFIGP